MVAIGTGRLVRAGRGQLALGAAGGQVLFKRIEQLPCDQIRVCELLERRLRLAGAFRWPAGGRLISGHFINPVLDPIFQGFGPGRKHAVVCFDRGLQDVLRKWRLGLRQIEFDGKNGLRLRPGLGLRDQALAEATRTLGPILAALDRLIGAFALTRAVAASVPISLRVPRPFWVTILRAWWLALERPERGVRRLGCRWPATRRLAPTSVAAFPSWFAAPLAIARRRILIARGRSAAIKILRFDVRDVEEAVAADREIDERGLNGRLEVDDASFINVAREALVAGSLDVKLFENTVFDDGDPAFLGLFHVDQHFFLHAISFRYLRPCRALWCGVSVVG